MASIKDIVSQQRAASRKAEAEARSEREPDLRADPWYFLDLDHGDERLRRWWEREDRAAARKRKT